MAPIASFDIDAQNCFTPICPNELPVSEGDQIVDELNKQARFAKLRIGSKDAHSPHAIWVATEADPQFSPIEGKNVDIRWKQHAVPGTKGFNLIDGLPTPDQYDFFIWKGVELDMHPYGACYHDLSEKMSTGVIEFLKCHDIQTIIVGGLATDYCVKTTVLQLLRAKFSVLINLAACRGIADETTKAAIEEMKNEGALIFNDSNAIKDYLS